MAPHLGPLEKDILHVLIAHPHDAYGLSIADRIEAAFQRRPPSPGAIYTVLERLERKGFVLSAWGEATAVRGGRRKRLYSITAAGRTAFNDPKREAGFRLSGSPLPVGA